MRAVAIASTLTPEELGTAPHVIARANDFTTLDPHMLALRLAA
jgi:hypothetical protein